MPQQRRIPQPRSERAERPKPQRRGGCFSALIYFLLVIGISALLAGVGWLFADDVLALTKDDFTATIDIAEDDDIADVPISFMRRD